MNDAMQYLENIFRKIIREEINSALIEFQQKEKDAKAAIEFLMVDEACRLLRISKPTLYKWMRSGIVTHIQIGGRVLFEKEQLIRAVRKQNAQSNS